MCFEKTIEIFKIILKSRERCAITIYRNISLEESVCFLKDVMEETMKAYTHQYINGEWREGGGGELGNYNPYTGELLYTYKAASQADVDDAYAAAREAQIEWAKTTPAQKVEAMQALIPAFQSLADDFSAASLEEGGKSINMAQREAFGCAHSVESSFQFTSMMNGIIMQSNTPGKENFIYRFPKGVVGIISPWNVPFGLAMRYAMPALACGNAVVLKPSSDTPASAFLIAEAFDKAGFPKGLFNAVAGRGADIGDYFIEHPVPAMLAFTGSSPVGGHLAGLAGAKFKDVSLEMGGNNVMIVLEDADIDRAVESAMFGKFVNNGQVCMAINRILLRNEIYDEFTEKFVAKARLLKCGDPSDPSVNIGPLVNSSQVKNVERLVSGSLAAGARAALEGRTDGNVVHPWILTEVTNDMPSAAEEVFGPVVSLIRISDDDEAVAIANDTEYGLSGCLWTSDIYRGMQISKQIDTGAMHINSHSISGEPHVMFGGTKASGKGRTGGAWFVSAFTVERTISYQP